MEAPPATDLPPANARIAHASPNLAANFNHPPYSEMITAAILAMKEKNGSSRQAIAKYIENKYTSLSPSHDSLLTQQIKRMKNAGQLIMVNRSYMLPPPPRSGLAGSGGSTQVADVPKRRPGRPPKVRPQMGENGSGQNGLGSGAPVFDPIGAAPTVVPIGDVDGPVKRRPGRPAKVASGSGVIDAQPVRAVVPETSVGKRRPGRPPKVYNGVVGVGSGVPTLVKRGRGRPKVAARGRGRPPRVVGPAGMGLIRRGRPKKGSMGIGGRPRGRPPKNVSVNNGAGVLPVKRAGRPSKIGDAKKQRRVSGKPLGRPRKDSSVAAIQASEQKQHLIAYQGLKGRIEHFQSRIKQAVSVVKPYLNNENAVIAIGALQELEELASMDLVTPLTDQGDPVAVQSQNAPEPVQNVPEPVQNAPENVPSEPRPEYAQNASGYVQGATAPDYVQNPSGYVHGAPGYVQGAYPQGAPEYAQGANSLGYNQGGYAQSAPGYFQSAPESIQKPTTFQGQQHFF